MSLTSLHFSNDELKCHGTTCGPGGQTGCNVNGVQQSILDALEQFRLTSGRKPVILDDAYRCKIHNAQVGGTVDSTHLEGLAADIRIEGLTGAQLQTIALQCPLITAIGRDDYENYIHIDTRSTETRIMWCYAANGTWTAYYAPPNGAQVA